MGQQSVQDDVVAIDQVDDPAARWDFALRAHPKYREAPQVHIQATVRYRGATPVLAPIALAMVATHTPSSLGGWLLTTLVSGAILLSGLGFLGLLVVTVGSVAAHGAVDGTELVWIGAAVVAALLGRRRNATLVIPPEIDVGAWEEFKDGFRALLGSETRILRGHHWVWHFPMAMAAALPFSVVVFLPPLMPFWSRPLIALLASVALTRLLVDRVAKDDDVVLACSAVGTPAENEIRGLAAATHVSGAVAAVAWLIVGFLVRFQR